MGTRIRGRIAPAPGVSARADDLPLMHRPCRLIALILTCLWLHACASGGQSQADPADEPRTLGSLVRDTVDEVTGEKRIINYRFEIKAPEALVKPIREQTFVGRWRERADYDPVQFDGLVARLDDEVQAILRASGYFNGKVTVERLEQGVRVSVAAGARTTVNEVDLQLVGQARENEPVRQFALSRWNLPEGSFFDSERWQDSKRKLIDALNQQGFLRARIVKSNARIDRQLTAASLSLTVDSGERLNFGAVQIEGLERYDRDVLLDLRPFTEQDPYTLDALLLYQARLRSSGYFSNVVVLPDLDFIEANPTLSNVPIRVELTELQTKRAAVGIGYSTDEGVRGQIGLEHRDLFKRNWQLESALVVSEKSQRAFANVRTPYDEDNYFNGFGTRVERESIEGLTTTRGNTYIGRGRRVGNIENFLSVQYQLESLRIAGNERRAEQLDSRQALVLGYSWNKRSLDSTVDPGDGYTFSAQLSGAREGLLTDRSFVRAYARGNRFIPLPRDSVFGGGMILLLGEYGLVAANDRSGIPSENLFRAGGGQSLRGYRYLSLGVKDGGAIVGGRFLLIGSVEYQHRLSDRYSLATFFDYGNASDSRRSYEPVAGYGIGLRMRTPIGPINLDVAYGRADERFRAHFSVGYTF